MLFSIRSQGATDIGLIGRELSLAAALGVTFIALVWFDDFSLPLHMILLSIQGAASELPLFRPRRFSSETRRAAPSTFHFFGIN
jgi:hypothetical protein